MTKTGMRPNDAIVRDLLLSGLTFSSGAVDAISFLSLGKVFSAFMTGNIAFLGLRLGGAGGPGWVSILLAMAGFSVGVYLGTRLVKSPTGEPAAGVWPRRVTVALGLTLPWHAAFLVLWLAVGGKPSTESAHYLLSFWGIAMGMQSAAVRTLRVDGVYTTAATATFIFVVGDLVTWSNSPEERLRLWGVLISLFLGAISGGFLLVHAHLYAPTASFAATILVVVLAAILFRNRSTPQVVPCSNKRAFAASEAPARPASHQ